MSVKEKININEIYSIINNNIRDLLNDTSIIDDSEQDPVAKAIEYAIDSCIVELKEDEKITDNESEELQEILEEYFDVNDMKGILKEEGITPKELYG